jgi:hypothetical protein
VQIYCSLNWQHQLCKNPRPNPDIKTLFVDHSCGQPNGARAPSPANNPLLGSTIPKPGGFPPIGAQIGAQIGAHGVSLLVISAYFIYMSKVTIVNNLMIYVCFSLFNLHQHRLHLWLVGCQTLQQ